MKRLTDLLKAVGGQASVTAGVADLMITAVTRDSRQVTPGTLFVAVKGEKSDGADFITQAKQSGAVAVLCESGIAVEPGVTVIHARDVRAVAARIAAAFYGRQPAHIAAITGTDGKTSTADFFRQLWHGMGKSSASMGTLGVYAGSGEALHEGTLTTPAPEALHAMLTELADKKIDYLAMEASSHGLEQRRLDGVMIEAAAFTNIARDHLDYHKTPEAYFEAKSRLFSALLPEGKTAVLNCDDAQFPALVEICGKRRHRVIGFGKSGGQLRVLGTAPTAHGQQVQAELFGKTHTLEVPLVGAFQVMNILAALGLVIGTGGTLEAALAALPALRGVPGRLERVVTLKNGATVFIDYAHTPAALANILNTLRPHTAKKLHVLFGCGGNRDAGKRPEMGRIASELADSVIVTDDNPRDEDPSIIRAAIMAASPHALEIPGRRDAIYAAVKALAANDVLVLAGKGHEKTQTIGAQVLPFDDAQVAREAVVELGL